MGTDPLARTPEHVEPRQPRIRSQGGRDRRTLLALPLAVALVLVTLTGIGIASARGAAPAAPRSVCVADPGKCISVTPGYGMPGTQLTLNGTTLTPGAQLVIGYSTSDCAGTIVTITGASGQVGADGTVRIVFVWPDTPAGTYAICATEGGSRTLETPGGFKVFTPTLAITSPVTSGDAVQVTGKGFMPTKVSGSQAEVLYDAAGSNGCANSQATVTVGDDGSFTASFNAPSVQQETTYVVAAVEPQKSCGASPNLQVRQNLVVQPKLTPSITVTPSVDAGGTVTVTGKQFSASGGNVEILYGGADGCQTSAKSVPVGADGTFSTTFTAPSPDKDTSYTVKAVQPSGACAQPKFAAQATMQVKGKAAPLPFPFEPGTIVFCVVGLLFLLLILAMLLLFLRRRRKDEPVMIQELDRVVVNAQGASAAGAAGRMSIERDVYAVDAKGNQQLIGQSRSSAEEVFTDEEEIVDNPRMPRYGPGSGGPGGY